MKTFLRSMPFAASFITPVLCGLAVFLRGPFLWLPPIFLFVLTPLMDALLGLEKRDLASELSDTWRDARFDVWLWLWAPLQLVILAGALVAARDATSAERVGLVFASGLLGGLGINVAHEWLHRKGAAERALAEVLLTSVAYAHFSVEHVLGHHRNVATPHDPASAAKGDIVYAFVPRSVLGGLRSAWRLESARVKKLSVPFGLRDRRVRYPLVLVLVALAIGVGLGPAALGVFVGQATTAVGLLEVINYVEHYGLARREESPGVYARVEPEHSWSSAHRLTGLYLFNLPRHADHHAQASRPFYALRHVDDSPQMPAGYATMLLAALVPPLWRAVMDARVDTWNATVR